MTDTGRPKHVLFVCMENCNRQIMADTRLLVFDQNTEGIFNQLNDQAISGGRHYEESNVCAKTNLLVFLPKYDPAASEWGFFPVRSSPWLLISVTRGSSRLRFGLKY